MSTREVLVHARCRARWGVHSLRWAELTLHFIVSNSQLRMAWREEDGPGCVCSRQTQQQSNAL